MGSRCAKPARPAGVELGNAPSPSRRGPISVETGSSAQGEKAAGQVTPPAAGSAAQQLAASAAGPGPGPDLLDRLPMATIAAVSSAVDAWNNMKDGAGTGGNTVASLLSSVSAAVPGFAQTLGALGEHAPLVGVIFSVLKVAGDRVAKTSATRAQYEAFARTVTTTMKLVLSVMELQAGTRQPFPTPVRTVLDLFWAQLEAFAQVLVECRGHNYAQRLWSQGKQQEQLEAIRRRIESARADLGTTGLGALVIQGITIKAKLDAFKLATLATKYEDARDRTPTWTIERPDRSFVGRGAELARLAELLRPAPAREPATRIVITGMGGTGKSTLARFAVQQHHARFSGGWVVDGSTEAAFLAGLAAMARGLGLGDVKPEELASAVTRKLSEPGQQGWLLVVDNVDDNAFKPRLLKWLPTIGGCVVVTSRLARWAVDWTVLPLSELAHADAIRLLSDKVREEDVSVLEMVASALSDLPLALVNARVYVQRTEISWREYMVKFKAQAAQLLNKGGTLPSLEWSLKAALQENGDAEALLQIIQVLRPGRLPRSLVVECLSLVKAGADADELLALLADYSIIDLTSATVTTHRLMQAAMRTRTPCPLAILEAVVKVISETVEKKMREDFSLMRQLLVQLEELLPLLEQQAPGSLALASAWSAVGLIQSFSLGNDIPAYGAFQKALALQQAVLGEQHVDVAKTLRRLGASSLDAQEAKAFCEKAVAIYVQLHGRDHIDVASTLVTLSNAYGALGDYAQQKALLEEAVPIMERHYGPDHVEVAAALRVANLGNAVGALGDAAQKKALLERALAINERHYGHDHPEVAITLTNLSNAYMALGDYAQQKALLERALAIQERHYGPKHPTVAQTLASLGNAVGALGEAAQQKALLERALVIQERYHGPDHPKVAITLKSLSIAYSTLGDGTKSKELLERALTIEEQYRGPS